MPAVQTDGTDWYVPIPKCGTQSLRHCFPDWRGDDHFNPNGVRGFAVVRHPVDRWFSGVAETAREPERPYDLLLDEARAGRMSWDNHTRPQSPYVRPFDGQLDLVRIESAGDYVRERFGRRLTWKNAKSWEIIADLVPAILEAFAADLALWEAAT